MEIAIFPIPNCVTFPGQTVSLHVFEPRYREMVEDCIAQGRPLAVCGVKRLLEKPKEKKVTLETALTTNLSTFEPVPVVSYGTVDVIEKLADGRLLVEVQMEKRAKIESFTEVEPYYIAQASALDDEELPASATQALLRAEISARFEALWHLVKKDDSPVPIPLESLSFSQVSFQVLGFLQTDPILAQILLEEQNPERRASILLDILCSLETRTA
ncbi:MAG: ATP-dependent protease [Proteobacteria bacterium]|nr:MAG: ATP-dependent protease [Pseudomonadota bacterium]